MAASARKQMTVEEFFEWQLRQEDRYELVEGVPVKMMAGASNFHDVILVNILGLLHSQLRGSPCRASSPDSSVRTRTKSIRRPDVTVTCEPPLPNTYEARDPRLVVEVLSPSNVGVTWERKLGEYYRLQGLKYLLLVDSREIKATLFTRTATDWEPTDADDLDAIIELPEISCRLTMREIYEGLQLEAGEAG